MLWKKSIENKTTNEKKYQVVTMLGSRANFQNPSSRKKHTNIFISSNFTALVLHHSTFVTENIS